MMQLKRILLVGLTICFVSVMPLMNVQAQHNLNIFDVHIEEKDMDMSEGVKEEEKVVQGFCTAAFAILGLDDLGGSRSL